MEILSKLDCCQKATSISLQFSELLLWKEKALSCLQQLASLLISYRPYRHGYQYMINMSRTIDDTYQTSTQHPSSSTANLFTDNRLFYSFVRKPHIPHWNFFRRLGYAVIILIAILNHHQIKHLQQYRNHQFTRLHSLQRKYHQGTIDNHLGTIMPILAHLQKSPTLWLFHNRSDIKSKLIENNLLWHMLSPTFLHPAMNITRQILQQIHAQLNENPASLWQLAKLAWQLDFYKSLSNPQSTIPPSWQDRIALIKSQQQNIQVLYDDRESVGNIQLFLKQLLRRLWVLKPPLTAKISTTASDPMIRQTEHDLLSAHWKKNPLLNTPSQQQSALLLMHELQQPQLFKPKINLSYFIMPTLFTNTDMLPTLDKPDFFKKKLRPLLMTNIYFHRHKVGEGTPNEQIHKNKPILKKFEHLIKFYQQQYRSAWIKFINSWHLKPPTSTNNLHWLNQAAQANSPFIRTIMLANLQLTREFRIIPLENTPSYMTKHTHLKHSYFSTHLLKSKVATHAATNNNNNLSNHTDSQLNQFTQQLEAYRLCLVKLYNEMEMILNDRHPAHAAHLYTQQLFTNKQATLALLLANQHMHRIENLYHNSDQAQAMQHLLAQPLTAIWGQLQALTEKDLNLLWEKNIYAVFKQQLADNYPCNSKASMDADPNMLQQWLIGPQAKLTRFIKKYLSPYLNNTHPTTAAHQTTYHLQFNPISFKQLQTTWHTLRVLESSAAPGSLSLQFELHPIPNPLLWRLKIDLPKAHFDYQNGPESWSSYHIIAPSPYNHATITVNLLQDRSERLIIHQLGSFAALHMLSEATWICQKNTTSCTLSWPIFRHKHRYRMVSVLFRSPQLADYKQFLLKGLKLPQTLF